MDIYLYKNGHISVNFKDIVLKSGVMAADNPFQP